MKFVRLPKFYLKKLNSYTLITCKNNCIRVDKNNENSDLGSFIDVKHKEFFINKPKFTYNCQELCKSILQTKVHKCLSNQAISLKYTSDLGVLLRM